MIPFPHELLRAGPLVITDTMLMSLLVALVLVIGLRVAMAFEPARDVLAIVYDFLDQQVRTLTPVDVGPLVPLVLTLWLFIALANLLGVVPHLASPTRDLGVTAALAAIAFLAGHVHAIHARGLAYLRAYLDPSPILLPFNIIGELSRTIALALRLFGNMLSAALVGAIVVYLAGLLVPVPLLLLDVLTSLVQAYIFGVLTLVFAAGSLESAGARANRDSAPHTPGKTS